MTTSIQLGQVIRCKINGIEERFKIVKIGRKYAYLKSCDYSSDGIWFMNIKDINRVDAVINRC